MLQQSKSVFVIENMIRKTLITNWKYNPPFFQRFYFEISMQCFRLCRLVKKKWTYFAWRVCKMYNRNLSYCLFCLTSLGWIIFFFTIKSLYKWIYSPSFWRVTYVTNILETHISIYNGLSCVSLRCERMVIKSNIKLN